MGFAVMYGAAKCNQIKIFLFAFSLVLINIFSHILNATSLDVVTLSLLVYMSKLFNNAECDEMKRQTYFIAWPYISSYIVCMLVWSDALYLFVAFAFFLFPCYFLMAGDCVCPFGLLWISDMLSLSRLLQKKLNRDSVMNDRVKGCPVLPTMVV